MLLGLVLVMALPLAILAEGLVGRNGFFEGISVVVNGWE